MPTFRLTCTKHLWYVWGCIAIIDRINILISLPIADCRMSNNGDWAYELKIMNFEQFETWTWSDCFDFWSGEVAEEAWRCFSLFSQISQIDLENFSYIHIFKFFILFNKVRIILLLTFDILQLLSLNGLCIKQPYHEDNNNNVGLEAIFTLNI